MQTRINGITPAKNVPGEVLATLRDNQLLMLSMGFAGTPGIVVRNSDGLVQKYRGMPQQDAMVEIMDPR